MFSVELEQVLFFVELKQVLFFVLYGRRHFLVPACRRERRPMAVCRRVARASPLPVTAIRQQDEAPGRGGD